MSHRKRDAPLWGALLRLEKSRTGTTWRFATVKDNEVDGEAVGEWPLRLRSDATRGRYIVAARDLDKGELVCSEEPFVRKRRF